MVGEAHTEGLGQTTCGNANVPCLSCGTDQTHLSVHRRLQPGVEWQGDVVEGQRLARRDACLASRGRGHPQRGARDRRRVDIPHLAALVEKRDELDDGGLAAGDGCCVVGVVDLLRCGVD